MLILQGGVHQFSVLPLDAHVIHVFIAHGLVRSSCHLEIVKSLRKCAVKYIFYRFWVRLWRTLSCQCSLLMVTPTVAVALFERLQIRDGIQQVLPA